MIKEKGVIGSRRRGMKSMCGFMVYTANDIKVEDFEESFIRISYRGPDFCVIENRERGLWGFHRLSIMGLTKSGNQPFELHGNLVVCNGELYGFKEWREQLKHKYTFYSDSDCEIILPLYETYGLDFFKQLDAEFALVIYDAKKDDFIAGRDPIGIRPLFYGYSKNSHKIMFASEAKALVKLCDEVYPFPPGYYYADGAFTCYYDAAQSSGFYNGSIEEITKEINTRLIEGVRKRLDADVPVGFLLSGGLDSSLVCSIAAKLLNRPIKTFAIGMETDAIDLKYAKEVADYIGSDHTEVIINKDDVINCLEEVIYILETYDITTIRASIGMYLLCKAIREQTDVKVLLTGEISDELFGYKYTDYAPSATAFQEESQKRIRELYMYDVLRADRCILANSIEARVPFGDLAFVDYVMGVNPQLKLNQYNKGKYLLRKAFVGDYLPQSILMREKAAFSDAVGHSLVDILKDYAESQYTDEVFEKKVKNYEGDCVPFTKESLLYREIFDRHFNGHAKWIKDYWMPNKAWEGCNVLDPSARVLANYGDSGK